MDNLDRYITLHYTYFYRRSLQLCKNVTLAEDILQESLMQIFKHREKLSSLPDNEIKYYTNGTIRNTYLDYLRRDRVRQMESIDDFEWATPSVEEQDFALELKDLQKALRIAPVEYRQTILALLNSKGYEEVTEKLNVPIGTVKSRINRVRKYLRDDEKMEESKADDVLSSEDSLSESIKTQIQKLLNDGKSIYEVSKMFPNIDKMGIASLATKKKRKVLTN